MASSSTPITGETRISEYLHIIVSLFGTEWRQHEADLIQMIDDTEDAIYASFERRNPTRRK